MSETTGTLDRPRGAWISGSSPGARALRATTGTTPAEAERLVALLRVAAIPVFALGETLPRPDRDSSAFYSLLAAFAVFACAVLVWTTLRRTGQSFGLAVTGVDVAAIAALAALSGGAFSPVHSAFFVLPVAVAFRFRPGLTAGAATAIVVAYVVQALPHPSAETAHAGTEIAVRAGFLTLTGVSAVVLSTLLERRTRRVAELSSAGVHLEARYRDLFRRVPLGLFRLDADGRLLDANPALLDLLGRDATWPSSGGGLPFGPDENARWRRLAQEGRLVGVELELRGPDGRPRWLRTTGHAVRDESGRTIGYEGSLEDVGGRHRAERELERRARQQAVVAELAQASLAAGDHDAFLAGAASAVARTLGVEYCKVLERRPGEHALLLRAGVGWRAGLVGHARVSVDRGSQAGFTLMSEEPVVTEDLAAETRFSAPPLLADHDVRSGVSVVIGGLEWPYGVLGAHSREPRRFGPDDVRFLQAVAGLIASAVERARADAALAESQERFAASRRRLLADALAAGERARQLLAEGLHDQTIQTLLAAGQDLDEAAAGDEQALGRARAAIAETVREIREAIFELDPRVYVQAGFEPALRAAALRAARRARFELRLAVAQVPRHHERLLFGAARQLLANAAQHSRARRVALRVARRPGAVVLTFADDGCGFDLDRLPEKVAGGHIGLASQRERVESAGGAFRIRSSPGRGTAVEVRLPT